MGSKLIIASSQVSSPMFASHLWMIESIPTDISDKQEIESIFSLQEKADLPFNIPDLQRRNIFTASSSCNEGAGNEKEQTQLHVNNMDTHTDIIIRICKPLWKKTPKQNTF